MSENITEFPIEHGPRTGETILMLHGNSTAGWSWFTQVEGMKDRHILTPDILGLGSRADTVWPGIAAVADDMADLIRERAVGARAHVVGLSLGGVIATHLVQRHPDLIHSCMITGSPMAGLGRAEWSFIALTVPLWRRRWFWSLQSRIFKVPPEDRKLFVDTAVGVHPTTNMLTFAELSYDAMPRGPMNYEGPFLAISGQKELPSVRKGFTALRQVIPQLQTWIAPGVSHAWSIEDPEMFNNTVRHFVDTGKGPEQKLVN